MPWATDAYSVAKDFQTLGAAIIAFSAAALTFYSQNRVARRASQTAIDVQDRTIKEQRIFNDVKEARFRLAFAVEMNVALGNVGADIRRRASQAKTFIKFAKTDDEGMSFQTNGADIVWKPLASFPPLIDKFEIFSTSLNDISRLDQQTQKHFHLLRQICSDVDTAITDAIQTDKDHSFVLSGYVTNIIDFSSIYDSHEKLFDEGNKLMLDELLARKIGDVSVRPS